MTRARYPYAELPAANPIDGAPWALTETQLRELMALCRAAPCFRPAIHGWEYVQVADRCLRDYRADLTRAKKLNPWPPRATLQAFADHAEALARAIDRLGGIDAATGAPDTAGMLRKTPSGPDLAPIDPAALRAMSANARDVLNATAAKRGASKSAGPRRHLIGRLWAGWHISTKTPRTIELHPDFVEVLRIVLAYHGTDRALQALVRRALTY